MLKEMPHLPCLAVVAFSVNDSTEKIKKDAITVRNLVESYMQKTGKYWIVSRIENDKLLENQKIQVSSISSADNIKKLQLQNQFQNINYIITGIVDTLGANYSITVKLLDVSTGQFSHSAKGFVDSNPGGLPYDLNCLMGVFNAGISSAGDGTIAQRDNAPKTGAGGTYKVGGFGPAGGIVFYDKGVFSEGWRYLEAAPVETDFISVQWGAYGQDVSGTSAAVGTGKRNTQCIVDRLKQLGESGHAAQLCDSLEFGGFSDWFLPSKDELTLMYSNLHQKGLGGFCHSWYCYWSSSQGSADYAWIQYFYFGEGRPDDSFKNKTHAVRAVRAF